MGCSSPPPIIHTLKYERYFSLKQLHFNNIVWSIIELPDNRIAVSVGDCSLNVISITYEHKKYKIDIRKLNAHEQPIPKLCVIPNNRLVSASHDFSIKIWFIIQHDLIPLTHIQELNTGLNCVIPLSTLSQIAVCSDDSLIHIIQTDEPYAIDKTITLKECKVSCIIELSKWKEVLVASCSYYNNEQEKEGYIVLYDIKTCKQVQEMKDVFTECPSGMIELTDGNVALTQTRDKTFISIINPHKCVVVKDIWRSSFLQDHSGLTLLNDGSFVYIRVGSVICVSKEYEVVVEKKIEEDVDGFCGVVPVRDGKYLVCGTTYTDIGLIILE